MTQLEDAPAANPFLTGVYEPVLDELDVADLAVSGEIPAALHGVYLRNGANPQFAPLGRYHWFDGDGMVHGVYLADGRATYRNRWVVTPGLRHERAAGHSLFGGILNFTFPPAELIEECGVLKNAANTNIVRHAGRYLALWEAGPPCEVTHELDTVGMYDFGGRLVGGMTAHPKWCPETGELMFFGYEPMMGPPYLRYHVAGADGSLVHSTPITLPRAVMMHDFLTTRYHSLFFDLPAVVGPSDGGSMFQPQHGARIGVVPRHGGDADVRWFEIEPCYVFHFLNAWEEHDDRGHRIVALGCRMPSIDLDFERREETAAPAPGTGLTRWTVDLTSGSCREELLTDLRADFPRLHDGRLGLPHRFGYAAAAFEGSGSIGFDGLVRYDLATGAETNLPFGAGTWVGEPVFATDPDGDGETDGWLLVYATDLATRATDLCIIEGNDFTGGVVARVHLPRRVPAGFHGNWLPDA